MRSQNREGEAGELAVIFDRKERFLAVGLYDPDSPIRVRILHTGKPRAIDRLVGSIGGRGAGQAGRFV